MADHLEGELVARYLARSALFWKFAREAKFVLWQKEARNSAWHTLTWDCAKLGISADGKQAAERLGFSPTEVFAHPDVLESKPELFAYYRSLACLSQKGFSQIRKQMGLSRKNAGSREEFNLRLCRLLNGFLSKALARTVTANREVLIRTMYAEAGSEWQGTWVNQIGELAAQELAGLIVSYAEEQGLVDVAKTAAAADESNCIVLKSGTTIRFGSEPDVECRSARNELLCVIEIKGSADSAGAQTRLGETKKSFAKARRINPRCMTIFLPSVLTTSVLEQLSTERDIDKVFNLLSIFKDPMQRSEFLTELFKYALRESLS